MDIMWETLTEWTITSLLLGLLLLYVVYWYLSIPNNIPPGPRGLPLLGYLPFMGKIPYQTLLLLDVGVSDGEFWRDHRRFAIKLMRDCGVGKISIESKIMDEIYYFLRELQKYQGKSVDCSNIINMSVANNISIMALGNRYDYNETTFLSLTQKLHDFNKLSGAMSVLTFFPWLKCIPGIRQLLNYDRIRSAISDFDQFLEQIVEGHKVNYTEGQRDHYVSAYITEQRARYNKSKQMDETFTDKALVSNMRMLEAAGIESTSTTLMWAIVFLMRHPDVQKKVQDELDQVIGFDRSPSWSDRCRTPYTEATICEIQRMGNLAPIVVPHRNTEECQLLGYKIPQDSYILTLLGNILSDTKLWGDPQLFRPERFLNNQGEVERPPYFIPFSTGRRQCLGETLAKMELYLYFTSMLQKFTFMQPTGERPSLDSHIGLTNIPKNKVSLVTLRGQS